MNCETAKFYYYEYLENGRVPADVKAHLEACPDCQKELGRLREELDRSDVVDKPWRPAWLQLHYRLLNQWVSCDTVRPFLPSLLASQLGVKRPTPVTAHVENCPTCQKALRQIASLQLKPSDLIKASRYLTGEKTELADAVHAVLDKIERSEASDVLTRMRPAQTDDVEHQWLLDSAVIDVEHRSGLKKAIPHRVSRRRVVSIGVAGGIAAAVLFVVFLVIPAGDVKAVDVEHLYMTIDNVRNVHIQKFGGSKELENIWISEGLGAYLFRQAETAVFVNKRTGKTFRQHQGAMQAVSQGGKMELERPWGLLPFKHISQLPASYEWNYITDTVLEGDLKVRIYEWTWMEAPTNQLRIKHTWRGYLDVHSYLPYRIECLDKIGDLPEELIMEMKVSYPSDAECREAFERFGFKGLVYGHQYEAFKKFPPASKSGSTDAGFVLSTWPSAKTALNLPEE